MNASILVNLPEDIFFELLFVWLELKSVNFLDSSFCNSKVRNYVLNCYKSNLLSVSHTCQLRKSFLRYIYLRGLKLHELNGDIVSLFSDLLAIDTSKVTSICDDGFSEVGYHSDWIKLINSCPRLSSLYLYEAEWLINVLVGDVSIDIAILKQLRILKITRHSDTKPKDFSSFAYVCHNLVEVSLCVNNEIAKVF